MADEHARWSCFSLQNSHQKQLCESQSNLLPPYFFFQGKNGQKNHFQCLFIYLSIEIESRSAAQAECSGAISAHYKPHPLGSSKSLASASRVAGITSTHHNVQLIFVFLVEMGVLCCWQVGLESWPQVIHPPLPLKVLGL